MRRVTMRKVWTEQEIDVLRHEYHRRPKAELLVRFGVTLQQLYRAADRYGAARRLVVRGADFDQFIRDRHGDGWADTEIVAAWNKKHPRRRCHRRTVGDRRNQLDLSSNAYNQRHRRRVAAKTEEQCAAAGVKNLAEVRAKAYEKFARERGWPDDVSPRQVQILDAIYEQGPRTRKQLAEVIGCDWKRQRNWLSAARSGGKQYQGGTYLTDLMHRGLVVRLPGRVVRSEPGSGKGCYLYAIPPHVRRKPNDQRHDERKTQRAKPRGASATA